MNMRVLYCCVIFCCIVLLAHATNRWPCKTQRDLKFLRDVIAEHGSCIFQIDFQRYLDKAQKIHNFAGYEAVLAEFVSGFNSNCYNLEFCRQNPKVYWPGFIVTYQQGAYVASYVTNKMSYCKMPPVGAQLIACDGIPVERYMKDYIKPYSSVLARTYAQQVPYIGIYDYYQGAHKLSYCMWLIDGQQRALPVFWQRRSQACLTCLIKSLVDEQEVECKDQPIKHVALPSAYAVLAIYG
ncbi:MAG TPA: hypothetical protein PKD74_05080 [Candidatus Dependentiae bacterium]|nr:hypothetical protein [Candidatus Dependentiae bacterium]